MLLVTALVPIALADDHLIVEESNGPRGSAITWTYVPPAYGVYTAKIVNSGLRWLVLEVYDNTSGMQELILRQKIRFSAYGAAPSGTVYTDPVMMAQWHTYEITATPNGPRSSSAVVSDGLDSPHAPTASFTMTTSGLTVAADGSGSWDADGVIVSYLWSWGDGTTGSGMTASHPYEMAGLYSITLTVTDDDGLTCTMSSSVISIGWVPQQTSRLIIDAACPGGLSPEGNSAHT